MTATSRRLHHCRLYQRMMSIAPPVPPVAAPDAIEIEPLVPELVVPELKTNRPLTPFAPAFAVLIVIAPLVVAVPSPVLMSIWPPVTLVPLPDSRSSAPPWPAVAPLP